MFSIYRHRILKPATLARYFSGTLFLYKKLIRCALIDFLVTFYAQLSTSTLKTFNFSLDTSVGRNVVALLAYTDGFLNLNLSNTRQKCVLISYVWSVFQSITQMSLLVGIFLLPAGKIKLFVEISCILDRFANL